MYTYEQIMIITTDDIDNTNKVIPVGVWRGYCLGMNPDGSPRGSNSTWAQYKRDTGYSIKGVKEPRDKFITQRSAYKLFVRSRLDEMCCKLKIVRPEKLTPMILEGIADRAISVMGLTTWSKIIDDLFMPYENEETRLLEATNVDPKSDLLDSEGLDAFLVNWLGKSVPLSTKRRKCKKAKIKYSTKKNARYTMNYAVKIAETLKDSWQ